jgi:hypothetical protein
MIGSGAAVGLEAARRLAELGSVQIEPGLPDRHLDDVERRFGFEFADDHRAFLAAGLPTWATGLDDHPDKVSWGWPTWRNPGAEDLRQQVEWPTDCVRHAISNGHWPNGWVRRPSDPERMEAKAQRLLETVPRMVPVYAHRYLPAGRTTSGHPVLSIHTLDNIVYGLDLADYVGQEFRNPTVTVSFLNTYL